MWALAYMFVVSLPHPRGSSAGSSEWWSVPRRASTESKGARRHGKYPVLQIYRCANWRREQRSQHAGHAKEITFSHTLRPLPPFPGPWEKPPRETSQEPSERGQNRAPDGAREWPPASEDPPAQAQRQHFVRFRLPVPVEIDPSARVDR